MYTTVLNPTPEEYKRVCLDLNSSHTLMTRHGFFQDPKNSDALIAPPRLVDEAIRCGSLSNSYDVVSVEDPDPENYDEYLALRIRGEVPLVAKYADELTKFDPRFHRASNTVPLSPHMSISGEDIKTQLQKDNPMIMGDLAPLEKVKEMGETELFDASYEGGRRFPGFPKLIQIGEELNEEFDSVEAKYGGRFFIPYESHPHGTFEITSIYACMESYDEEVEEWMENKIMDVDPETESADEFDTVTREDDHNPKSVSYVRAWWD